MTSDCVCTWLCPVGVFPEDMSVFPDLLILDVRRNKMSGRIPGSLCRCTKLRALALDGNNFEGMGIASFPFCCFESWVDFYLERFDVCVCVIR